MSAPRPVFGPKKRRAANDAQLLEFFRGYDRSWRLAKLVLTRSLMRDRARLQPDLQAALGPAFSCDEQYIYGPVTSGLLFSAIAELMMLAEDLFALLRHIRSRERFANSIVHYDAGRVTSVAGQLKTATLARLASAFMVPTMATMGEAARSITTEYGEAVARLALFARRASDLFDRYSFPFGQYKHGLTAALRPFGGHPLTAETIARRKDGLNGTVVCYEALQTSKSPKGRAPVVQFTLLPETRPFLVHLHNEDNLLRFHGEPRDTNIEDLVDAAYDLTMLVDIVVNNRLDLISPKNREQNTFWLPPSEREMNRPLALMEVAVGRNGRAVGPRHIPREALTMAALSARVDAAVTVLVPDLGPRRSSPGAHDFLPLGVLGGPCGNCRMMTVTP
jgi:hypothetical protein